MKIFNIEVSNTQKAREKAKQALYSSLADIMQGKLDPELSQPILNAAKRLAKKDPVNFFAGFVRHQHYEYAKEISHWKNAILEARDNYRPRRVLLTELYDDIARDGFVYGIMQHKRILKISNRKFKIVNEAGEENESNTKLLRKKWFNDLLKLAMQSKFYGYSLVYFDEWESGQIKRSKLVWRTHVIPDKNWIIKQVWDLEGTDYTLPPFNNYVMGCGDATDLGIFEKAAPLWILKKHSWSSWDRFEELFGIPMRTVKTATTDKKVRDEIVRWLDTMGTASYGLFPQDTEIDIKDNSQTDAYQVFDAKIKAANQELEILITGTNRVTATSGSRAKEQVIQEEVDEVTEDDKTFIRNLINDSLLPILRANGYPIAEGETFEWEDSKQMDPLDRLKVYESAKTLGFTPKRQAFENEFGIELEEENQTPPKDTPTLIANLHKAIHNLYTPANV